MNSMYILGQSLRIVSEEAFTLVISDEDEADIKETSLTHGLLKKEWKSYAVHGLATSN